MNVKPLSKHLRNISQLHQYFSMPDMTKPFILEMDASKWAIGAMLLQKQEDGQIHPCGYLSHALTQTERNWQIYDH